MSSVKCLKCVQPLGDGRTHYGLHEHCFLSWFNTIAICEFTGVVRKSASKDPDSGSDAQKKNSSFFQGKFRKYSADLNGKSYILKVREDEAPELPDVEYICNRIAEKLGIPVAKYYCVEYLGERTFATKNFVDKKRNTNLSHIYHHKPEREPRNCEVLIEIIYEETKRFLDIETFIHTCMFDSLIGNHDRHGRNLGLLSTASGYALAPIYDNPSALGLEKGEWLKADFSPKGRIPTSTTDEPTIKDYVAEFIRLGRGDAILAFHKRVDFPAIEKIIDEGFCSELMKQALKKLIASRVKELADAVPKRS